MSGPGAHSPVGASAIKRALLCEQSVELSAGIEDEESDHAAMGTAVHSLIEECFRRNIDAWQLINSPTVEGGLIVNKDMADGAQVMLNAVRKAHPDRNQGNFFIERRFHCPTIHPLFFGTSDCVYLEITYHPETGAEIFTLHIWDYKNGAGVVIEVQENEQGMYYACGALEDMQLWDKVDKVVIHIVQPNAFHQDGPVREWETTTEDLVEWLEDVCIPGIERATGDGEKTIASGEHCRFCPARSHACPQLMADMNELEALMNKHAARELTNEELGRLADLFERAKIVSAAGNKTMFNRMNNGGKVPGYKLVKKKVFRQWKDTVVVADGEGAQREIPVVEAARLAFGEQAFTPSELKSPAEMEKLPLGAAFATQAAFKPDAGLTVARASDTRAEVSPDTKSLFQPVTKADAPAMPQHEPEVAAKRRGAHLKVVV